MVFKVNLQGGRKNQSLNENTIKISRSKHHSHRKMWRCPRRDMHLLYPGFFGLFLVHLPAPTFGNAFIDPLDIPLNSLKFLVPVHLVAALLVKVTFMNLNWKGTKEKKKKKKAPPLLLLSSLPSLSLFYENLENSPQASLRARSHRTWKQPTWPLTKE